MHSAISRFSQLLLGVSLVAATSGSAFADLVTVSPTVTASAGFFNYAYAISNNTLNDTFLIDIPVPKGGAISSLTAPGGFTSAYDSGLGLVSFLEDSSFFTSTPTPGFSFLSPFAPGAATFSASEFNPSTGNIDTVAGSTLAPTAATPEPGYLGLMGVALCAAFCIKRFSPGTAKPSV